MTTWTIDDMPESQRPKRTIFRAQMAPVAEPQPGAEPPEAPTPTQPDPSQYIHCTEFDRFREFILDALPNFPDARAAVVAAVKRALAEKRAEGEPARTQPRNV